LHSLPTFNPTSANYTPVAAALATGQGSTTTVAHTPATKSTAAYATRSTTWTTLAA
jgi:hypothetical protein